MSRRTQRPSRRYRLSGGDRPDVARVYGSEAASATPRMAQALWRSTRELEGVWHGRYNDPYDLEVLLLDLPECAERAADQEWLTRFSHRFRLIRTRLEVGDLSHLPTCVGDELALYLVFDQADSEVFLWQLDNDAYHQQLPALRGDECFRTTAEAVFPDTSIIELLQYAESGGVYDEPNFNRHMAGATAEDWFPGGATDRWRSGPTVVTVGRRGRGVRTLVLRKRRRNGLFRSTARSTSCWSSGFSPSRQVRARPRPGRPRDLRPERRRTRSRAVRGR